MKRGQILLFIVSVIISLAALCIVFPENGINIGKVNLRFPDIAEVLVGDKDKSVSADEITAKRENLLSNADKEKFESFFNDSPIRFHIPGNDPHHFDSLFTQLENANDTLVRIIHYGDSQLEEDRITEHIRTRIQEKFGGSGQGMMPLHQHAVFAMGGSASAELKKYLAYGDPSFRANTDLYGPYADFTRLQGGTCTMSYYPIRNNDIQYFNHLSVVVGNTSGEVRIKCDTLTKTISGVSNISLAAFNLPDSTSKVRFSISGTASLYAALLDSKTGVAVDNVAFRGCSGTIFTNINQSQLKEFYSKANVKLIIMQFGGNMVPYIRTDEKIAEYAEIIKKQILHIKNAAPKDATLIFIGPSDMATTIKGKRQSYPHIQAVIDSLVSAANSCGVAYWDLRAAMGGENSMVAWVKATPPMAGPDYLHFTSKGSEYIGNLFCDALLTYYEYYRKCKE